MCQKKTHPELKTQGVFFIQSRIRKEV